MVQRNDGPRDLAGGRHNLSRERALATRPAANYRKQPGNRPVDTQQEPDLIETFADTAHGATTLKSFRHATEAIGKPLVIRRRRRASSPGAKAGINAARHQLRRMVYEIPFDSDRKMMSVVVRQRDDSLVMYTKGCRK